ncbi:tRAP transporter 4TM/12TM fusion protein [Coprococcus sp. CAG:782]|uniref:TRAP transporter permease n=1 Tax=Coprococcus sp. OM04-5BH TaxID=2293093 RepID=UPI000335CC4F|nr:TRAP transporter permease [Coprococcus sp. CAG:782]CCY54158.1 tRAP transporter 4TM/12TM fusion protein [Coprococcus sp. CAG:782]
MGGKTRKELEKDLQNQELQFDLEEESKLNDYDAFVDEKDNSIHENIDTVMRKYDRESNTRVWVGKPKTVISVILAAFSLWCIYVTLFATFLEEIRLTSFMGMIILMGFLIYPAKKGTQKVNYMPWYDIVMMVVGSAAFFYFTFNAETIVNQGTRFEWYQIAIGVVGILALIEVTRRCVGMPILIVAGFFILYAMIYGLTNPDFFLRLRYFIRNLFYTKEGIFSTPVNVCSKYIVVFIIFGAFLERTGISNFFIELANCVAGRFAGGPAKVAVISSALCGMVSGSSVGNTVTTGSVTIPMMKKTGYDPEFAGAVEAASSTGGQIMPPIMGAAAFLMADFVGVPYSSIIGRAILPAILYFTGIFISVHLEAKRLNLSGIPKEKLPKMSHLLKKIYLLLPLVMLVVWVSGNYMTMQKAASYAIVLSIVVSLFDKENRITPHKVLDALVAGGKSTITVGAACGVAGIIAGTITMTGLANDLINAIVGIAGDKLIIALILTMLCCIVLGMGVPTTANYCIMAATTAPILIRMGVPTMAAHFFVFYFGIVADITPPVALAAYAGSAIAKSKPMKTAFNASKLAIAVFIVPYMFCYTPAMLLIDTTPLRVVQIAITAFIGVFAVASALEGYCFARMHMITRIVIAAGGLMLIHPALLTDVIGIAVVVAILVFNRVVEKKKYAATAV